MISIDRNRLTPPVILSSPTHGEMIKKSLQEKDEHRFNGKYIKEKICKDLKTIYNNKCAYCETDVGAGTVLEYDHYRPKKGVKEDKAHPGYYWLGYEWTNLVPVCPGCNRKKSNQFPIEGERAQAGDFFNDQERLELDRAMCKIDSTVLRKEIPLLLHPEIDQPEDHLVFFPGGNVEGKTPKGKKTIDVCGLNREGLILARMKIVNDFLAEIRELLSDFVNEKIDKKTLRYCLYKLLNKIRERSKPGKAYSRFGVFMAREFESFFIELLKGPKQQQLLRKAFEWFKKNENRGDKNPIENH